MAGLAPRIHPLVASFLRRRDLLDEVVARFGSPVHVVFPEVFAENVAAFRALLDGYGFRYRICYAHKVNQSRALVRAALRAGLGVDVASPGELANALASGFTTDHIEVTGPKGDAFLRDLVTHELTVNVDNLWELDRVACLAARQSGGHRAAVLLRMCGFGSSDRATPASRFGIPLAQATRALELVRQRHDVLDFRGLSFHLDTNDVRDKVAAVDACLALVERAYALGLTPRVLDVGGGFRQVFLADAGAFDDYLHALRRGLAGDGEPLTWAGHTFGYSYDGGAVRGIPVFHKYGNSTPGPEFLRELLDSPLDGHDGRTVAQVLADNLLELWVEPGKALVDQAGLTLAGVEFVKEAADGSVLVNLDIARDTITPADQEVMVDPAIVYRGARQDYRHEPCGVYFAGNLCLERDMVSNHKIWLERLPLPGDLVVFVNTAGYQMDLSASQALMRPRPPKLAAVRGGADFTVHPDAAYGVVGGG
ncbi:decarboxylase [Planosporangium thailandense]|uniref:Decarboxylase n=1 Tax=Planosporangium thailandense TaxID=765197 RepID=A0ABX0Y297_9ACTN|nr:alanine racemase [Planosporangium thailandense]NJC72465.1 decarboxylase [Planosporangium thailandense]